MTQQLVLSGISIAISFTLSLFFPFYISLPLMIGIFAGLNYYLRRRMIRKMGMNVSMFGNNSTSLSYYCMQCGTKMKRAGF